jgi:hypothetical protein
MAAVMTRNKFAVWDVYDICFFLKPNWHINETVVQEKTGLPLAVEKSDHYHPTTSSQANPAWASGFS